MRSGADQIGTEGQKTAHFTCILTLGSVSSLRAAPGPAQGGPVRCEQAMSLAGLLQY